MIFCPLLFLQILNFTYIIYVRETKGDKDDYKQAKP